MIKNLAFLFSPLSITFVKLFLTHKFKSTERLYYLFLSQSLIEYDCNAEIKQSTIVRTVRSSPRRHIDSDTYLNQDSAPEKGEKQVRCVGEDVIKKRSRYRFSVILAIIADISTLSEKIRISAAKLIIIHPGNVLLSGRSWAAMISYVIDIVVDTTWFKDWLFFVISVHQTDR